MNKLMVFATAITLSTSVFAGNMQKETKSGHSMHSDMSSMHENMKSMHNDMDKKFTQADTLGNEDMQRLHKEMTESGMSEMVMEARRNMMTNEGRAYHRALK